MSKFKVGDKVAISSSPNVLFGQVECETFGGYYIKMEKNYYAIVPEDELVPYDEIPNITNHEIYYMLKPKLDKYGVFFNGPYGCVINQEDAIALAYRSGYLRAKKGRSFKIGGEKE